MFTRVKLYKNCILSARNTEVFRTATLLESYLATLNKPYTADIDIDNVYTTLSGRITIDATGFNGDFNYIVFEQYETVEQVDVLKQKVYAFVDSFRIVNDLLVINYITDIWHTYIDKCTLRDSLMSRSIWRKKSPLVSSTNLYMTSDLPVRPLFNGGKYSITASNSTHKFCIIAKMQYFLLDAGGNPQRSSFIEEYALVKGATGLTISSDYTDYEVTSSETAKFIQDSQSSSGAFADITDLIYQQQNNQIWIQYIGNNHFDARVGTYANIVKLYLIPENWITESTDKFNFVWGINSATRFIPFSVDGTKVINNYYGLVFTQLGKPNFDFECYTQKITRNYENISIGFYSAQFKYDYIGLDTGIKILSTINHDEFSMYLCYNGIKTEITDLFEMVQDYDVVSAEVTAQRAIARKVETVNGIMGTIQGMTQIGVGIAQMGAGLPSIPYTTAESPRDVFGIPIPQEMHKSPVSIAGGIGNIAGGISSIVGSVTKLWSANADKYAPIISQHNNSNAEMNAHYGFIILSHDSVLNAQEIVDAIKQTGYGVRYIVDMIDIDDYDYTNHKPNASLDSSILDYPDTPEYEYLQIKDYNVIKFDFVRIVGLSDEICNAIADILMEGVKVWYTDNV